jgi:phosphoribosylformylglycinamidine synthase
MAKDVIIAIQDMGAAGLTCSTSEMADKGGVGIELNLDDVPQRESEMTAYEMMLSGARSSRYLFLCRQRPHDNVRLWLGKLRHPIQTGEINRRKRCS